MDTFCVCHVKHPTGRKAHTALNRHIKYGEEWAVARTRARTKRQHDCLPINSSQLVIRVVTSMRFAILSHKTKVDSLAGTSNNMRYVSIVPAVFSGGLTLKLISQSLLNRTIKLRPCATLPFSQETNPGEKCKVLALEPPSPSSKRKHKRLQYKTS